MAKSFIECVLSGIIINLITSSSGIENGFMELFGGHIPGTGHVKIFNDGKWGAVCDDGWVLANANVVCRTLGFQFALGHSTQSWFGEADIEILLDDVQCYGDEETLLDCKSSPWGWSDCTASELAGVFCSPSQGFQQELSSTNNNVSTNQNVNNLYAQLNNTSRQSNISVISSTHLPTLPTQSSTQSSSSQAPLEVLIDHQNNPLENQLENQLQFGYNLNNHQPPQPNTQAPSVASIPHQNDSIDNQLENQLQFGLHFNNHLPPQPNAAPNISHANALRTLSPFEVEKLEANDAASRPEAKEKINELLIGSHLLRKKIHKPEAYNVRLINGRTTNEGRVEVLVNQKWHIICSDHWTLFESNVVCQQANQGYALMAVKTNSFGGQGMKKIFGGIVCDGDEGKLSECYHGEVDDVTCEDETNVAGVICSKVLPDLVTNITMLQKSAYLEDRPLGYMECAMEEGCASASAYTIRQTYQDFNLYRRRLLRFSSSVWNFGTADFRPHAPKALWEWHACHMHYHSMGVFAHYDVLDFNGNRVAEGHKASFCLEDVECLDGIPKRYQCANYGNQGISVGCADNYLHDIDCQWIDVTDVIPGKYLFRITVNPGY